MAQKPPFREQFEWRTITRKGNNLYLILSGNRPADGKITLNVPGCKLQKADIKADSERTGDDLHTARRRIWKDIQVICATFDQPVKPQPMAAQRTPNYSYSCFDYYSNYRSTVSYQWSINKSNLNALEFTYTRRRTVRNYWLK